MGGEREKGGGMRKKDKEMKKERWGGEEKGKNK